MIKLELQKKYLAYAERENLKRSVQFETRDRRSEKDEKGVMMKLKSNQDLFLTSEMTKELQENEQAAEPKPLRKKVKTRATDNISNVSRSDMVTTSDNMPLTPRSMCYDDLDHNIID